MVKSKTYFIRTYGCQANEADSKRNLKLTIAIVTFNCLEYTKLFLKSLHKNADFPYRLIVVDNNSTDGTKEFLRHQKNIKVIFNKRNLGFGPANNQAFRLAKTPYFLGINNDTVIFPGFLNRLLEIVKEYPSYAEFGVHSNCIGARNPQTRRKIDGELKKVDKQKYPLEAKIRRYYGDFGNFFASFAKINQGILKMESPPNFIGGWCFLVKTEAVKEAGGLFDRQFRVGFWEDVDLSWRLAKAGYKIGLAKGIYLHHFTHVSFDQNKLRVSDHTISRANGLRFARKWSEEIRNFLKRKFSKGISLKEIISKYFIFRVFFGRKKDYSELEDSLKKNFLDDPKVNFRDFILMERSRK